MGKAVSASSITKALSGGRKAADLLKVGLQFLGRRQIVDIYGRLLPNLKTYSDIVQQMDAEKHDVSASADKLAENLSTAMEEVVRLKPSTAKGKYIQKGAVSTTFGPGIPLDVSIY